MDNDIQVGVHHSVFQIDRCVMKIGNGFGDRIQLSRVKAGISQTELARQADMTKGALSNLENGVARETKMLHLFALAKALRVNPEWLATGKGAMNGKYLTFPASEQSQSLAMLFDRLPDDKKETIERLIQDLLG